MSYQRVIMTAVGLAVFAMSCVSIGIGLALWHEAQDGNDVHPHL